MEQFIAKHADKVEGTLSCFDRVLFRGYLPFFSGAVLATFLDSRGVHATRGSASCCGRRIWPRTTPPYLEKPRFFGSLEAWRAETGRDGFCVERREAADVMRGRLRGIEYRLDVDRAADQAVFTDGRVTLELRPRERTPVGASAAPGVPGGHTLDVGAYLRMVVLLDGVLDPRRANPVNA